MAGNRSSIRGTRVGGRSEATPDERPQDAPRQVVADPTRPRDVVDYALQRRAALEDLFSGGGLRSDACDADPYLLRAAKWHGEPSERRCPVCRRGDLTHVTYTFGAQLGPYSGRVRASGELPRLATEFGEFRVYVVEVCHQCTWNHLVTSYILGDGIPRHAPRRPRDLLD